MECLAEDQLLELASSSGGLVDAPAIEAHLAECTSCSALLSSLVEGPPPAVHLAVNTMIGPYRIDGVIGRGAMGTVYRGWDSRLQRRVAIKLLSPVFAESTERVRRLEIEARAAAAVEHPNVVRVYDIGRHDSLPYIVSELIEGESLHSVIARGGVSRAKALDLVLQLCRGLVAAHAQGVIHRDLKPTNLILHNDGTLKIVDFGLAKVLGEDGSDATAPGTVLGTAGYFPPEQARGEPADARSDLFAVGAIAYELIAGRPAFGGATFAERLSSVLRDRPQPLSDPADAIIQRCLAKDARNRVQSAHDLVFVIERLVDGRPPTPMVSRRGWLIGAGAGASAALGGFVLGRWTRANPVAERPDFRQLTFRQGRVASARFTREGDTIVHASQWENQPTTLYAVRLSGGEARTLATDPAHLLAISTRGELAISIGHRFVEGFHQRGELAIVPLEGGEPRRLGLQVQHADFGLDGELAVVRRVRGGRFRLELPIGAPLLEANWIAYPRVSPDGTAVACGVYDSTDDDRGTVHVVTRDRVVRAIGGEWSSLDGIAWHPDGESLWISGSREGGNNNVRQLALDGRELAVVPTVGRLRLHDVAHDGRLAVSSVQARMGLIARAHGGPEIDRALSDISMVRDLAGDGSAFLAIEFGDVDTSNGAYVRAIDGSSTLRLGAAIPYGFDAAARRVIAYRFSPPGLVTYSLPAGQPLEVPVGDLQVTGVAKFAGRRVVVVATDRATDRPALWLIDGSRSTRLTAPGLVGKFAIDPSGSALAMIIDETLYTLALDPVGTPRAIGSFIDQVVCGWADGDAVYVRTMWWPIVVSRIDLATGRVTVVREIEPPPQGRRGADSLVISRDGESYAYSYGQELSRLYTIALR